MAEIKYQYAYDESKKLVSIKDITKENRNQHQYICIGCGNPLLPRAIGSKYRRPHFYHKELVDCSGETYLHKLAKKLIKEKFENSEKFEISYPVTRTCQNTNCQLRSEKCEDKNQVCKYDLKQYYDTCTEEAEINGFIADLLLTNSKSTNLAPVLIEVCVTHACEEEKRNSGLKIIEIKIKNEEDINALLNMEVWEETHEWRYGEKEVSGPLEFIAFKRTLKELMEIGIARYVFGKFENQQNGYITFVNCRIAHNKVRKDSLCELNLLGNYQFQIDYHSLFHSLLIWMYKYYNIRRCLICKFYYATMYEEHPICRLSKKYGKPKFPKMTEAEKCSSFHINDNLYMLDKIDFVEVKNPPINRGNDFYVIVAGSSSFRNYELLKEKCDYYLSGKIKTNNVVILSGTSNNTKEMITRYCVENGINSEPFEADWHIYGKDAHRICSAKMIEMANAVIAFWDGRSTYTKMLVDMAKEIHIKTAVVPFKAEKMIDYSEYYE